MHLNGFLILELKWLLLIYWVATGRDIGYRSEHSLCSHLLAYVFKT